MASVTEETPLGAGGNVTGGEASPRSTASEVRSYSHPAAQTADHPVECVNDHTRGSAAPEPASQDVQSQLLQKILGTLEESNKTLKESTQTLKASTIAQEIGTDTRSRFWATYKRHADDYDSEFLEKYKDDMDIVLIFSGLFSAVSTTFITGMQSSLSPDPTDTTNALLRQLIHATNSSTFAGQSVDPPSWNGPVTTVIWTQSFLYASLCASLLAALGAVLGKQWLGHYRRRGSGTIEERGKRRQQKLNGLEAWHFHAVLEVLPVLLQLSLVLFGVALSAYVWTEQSTIGAVVLGTTALGILFYVTITLACLISSNCPFQTPVSSILPLLLRLVLRSKVVCYSKVMRYFEAMCYLKDMFDFKDMLSFKDDVVEYLDHLGTGDKVIVIAGVILFPVTLILFACVSFVNWVEVKVFPWAHHLWQMVLRRLCATSDSPGDPESSPPSLSPPAPGPLKLDIPSLPIDSQGALSIKWLLETSTDPDVTATAAGMVPEVEWPVELDVSDLFAQLRDTFKGCFVPVPNDPIQWKLAPFGQERALIFGKAVVHLYCNRYYPSPGNPYWCCATLSDEAGNRELLALFASLEYCDTKIAASSFVCAIARLSLPVSETKHYRLYSLEWDEELPPVPESCRTWLLGLFPHLLAHPLCPPMLKLMAMAEITRWITSPFPPRHIVADCILSAAILIGVRIDRNELVRVDKSPAIELLLRQLQQHMPTVCDVVNAPPGTSAPLLQTLSSILEGEIQSYFGAGESNSCRCAAAKRGLEACSSWVVEIRRTTELNQAEQDPPRAVMWRYARAALHTSAAAPCAVHSGTVWDTSYRGHLGWEVSDDFHWTLAFLDHHHETHDETALSDMFVMLSQARDISLWAHEPAFVKAIVVGMGSDKPTRVRHAALRTAWEIREALRSPDKTILPMLPAFSAALRSAVLPNIHAEEDTTTRDSPDRSFYEVRDLHYLQIIYALVRSSGGLWDRHLHDNGHFDRCISLTGHSRYTTMAPYLVAIVENLEARGADHSFTNDDVGPLIAPAWYIMDIVTLDLEELLEALIAFTRRHHEVNARLADDIGCHVQRALSHLQREQPQSPVIGSLNKFLVWLG